MRHMDRLTDRVIPIYSFKSLFVWGINIVLGKQNEYLP